MEWTDDIDACVDRIRYVDSLRAFECHLRELLLQASKERGHTP